MRYEHKKVLSMARMVADGAMGTMLAQAGLPAGLCPEAWVFERPQAIVEVYRQYIEAGADIVQTNTFGGTPLKLAAYGLSEAAAEINKRAAQLASQTGVIAAGCIGPTGKLLEPFGDCTAEEAEGAFRVQAEALAEGGAHFLLLETFSDLGELTCAVKVAKETGLPIIACMSFDTGGRTMMGVAPKALADFGVKMELAGIGTNCGGGTHQLAPVVEELLAVSALPVIAQPNAGLPELIDGKTVFRGTPQEHYEFAARFAGRLAITGGCCGSTPEHIRAVAKAIKG